VSPFFRRKPTRPGQDDVARRVICLGAVVARGSAIMALRQTGDPAELEQARTVVSEAEGWLADEGLASDVSAQERAFLARSPDEIGDDELVQISWRTESSGVLLWALSYLDELPPYDRQIEGGGEYVPLGAPTASFIADAELRDESTIDRARDLAELWHWRARTTQLQRGDASVGLPDGLTLDEIVAKTANHAHERGEIPSPIDDDFPAFGKAYRELTEEEHSEASSIAMERQYALNWLCGYCSDWDEVSTDT
jgi:hypothetical protein